MEFQALVESLTADLWPLEQIVPGDMKGAEWEEWRYDSNKFHNPPDDNKMFQILLIVGVVDDSFSNGFDVDLLEDVFEKV